MPDPRLRLSDTLRRNGYRVTVPRRLVWEVLTATRAHLSAESIAEHIGAKQANVNLASVYRALALLEELDLVRSSRLGPASTTTWELAHPDEHFHLVCRICDRVEHHRGTLVDDIARHLEDGHGFQPATVELVVTGRCRGCSDQRSGAPAS